MNINYSRYDDLLDEIADWLTDEYEYCHDGFNVKEIKEE